MKRERLPFILLAMFALVTGLLAGLQRIGWSFPLNTASSNHGAIMIGGFLGTLISLEKIIPLKRKFLYVIPLLSGSSVIVFFIQQSEVSLWLLTAASVGLAVVFLVYWISKRSVIYALMLAGALCWITGNILLLQNGFYPLSVAWWMGFALLIISSERLELMQFLPITKASKNFFVAVLGTFVIGCFTSFHGPGKFLAALALIVASVWLMRFDVVAINLKKDGLTRYLGITLLSGYIALLTSGIFISLVAGAPLGYDVIVHSFFIGFVFSMIFAHGPIILPGVLGISVRPYNPVLYVWLVLLHASWIIRAFADIALNIELRRISGLLSLLAVVAYFISLVIIITRHRGKTV